MQLKLKTQLATMALPLLVTACAQSGAGAKQITAQDLQHHHWQLMSLNGKTLVLDEHQHRPNLEIGATLDVSGYAGCNNFFGQAELKNNQFRVEKMGMTMKMCIGDIMNTEQAFAQYLADWNSIQLTKDTLILKNGAHQMTFKLSDPDS